MEGHPRGAQSRRQRWQGRDTATRVSEEESLVHFMAVPRAQLEPELDRFLEWFNSGSSMDGLVRAGMDEFELRVARLIRIFREQDRNRELGPPPIWDGSMKRSRIGVYAGPWPAWKQFLFHLTSATCFLPARLSDFD